MINLQPPSNRHFRCDILVHSYDEPHTHSMVVNATESSAHELLNLIAKDLTEVTPKPEMRSTLVRLDCYVLTKQEYEDAINRAFLFGAHEERSMSAKRHALGVK
jgi:hypothetical protein